MTRDKCVGNRRELAGGSVASWTLNERVVGIASGRPVLHSLVSARVSENCDLLFASDDVVAIIVFLVLRLCDLDIDLWNAWTSGVTTSVRREGGDDSGRGGLVRIFLKRVWARTHCSSAARVVLGHDA